MPWSFISVSTGMRVSMPFPVGDDHSTMNSAAISLPDLRTGMHTALPHIFQPFAARMAPSSIPENQSISSSFAAFVVIV